MSQTASARLEARRKPISAVWMTYTLTVSNVIQRHHSCPLTISMISALGIADDVAALGLKGTKKKKGRKLDEDFIVCAQLRLWRITAKLKCLCTLSRCSNQLRSWRCPRSSLRSVNARPAGPCFSNCWRGSRYVEDTLNFVLSADSAAHSTNLDDRRGFGQEAADENARFLAHVDGYD
jgi:hypothetical protein